MARNNKVAALLISAIYLVYFFVVHRNIVYNYLVVPPDKQVAVFSGAGELFAFLVMLKLSFAGFALALLIYQSIKSIRSNINLTTLLELLSFFILATNLFNYWEINNRYCLYFVSIMIIFIPSSLFGLIYAKLIESLGGQYQRTLFLLLMGSALGVLLYNVCVSYIPFIYVYTSLFMIFQIFCTDRKNLMIKVPIFLSVLMILCFLSREHNWGQFYKLPKGRFYKGGKLVLTKFAPDGILDIIYLPAEDEYYMVSDKNGLTAIHVKGDVSKIGRQVMLPYTIKDFDKSLIIGVGGGRTIVTDLYNGVKDITAVDISKAKIDLMNNEFAAYSNYLFQDKRVKVINDSGRAFLRKSKKKFDLITIIRPVGTIIPNGIVYDPFQELFTEEAVDAYLEALSGDGIMFWYLPYEYKSHLVCLKKKFAELKNNMVIFIRDRPGGQNQDDERNILGVMISKKIDLTEFYLANKDRYRFIYYPGITVNSDIHEVLASLLSAESSGERIIDKQLRGSFDPLKLDQNIFIIVTLIMMLFLICNIAAKDERLFMYFLLGMGYEIVLIYFVFWLSMFTMNIVKLMPIAFTLFFAMGSFGYLHSWQIRPKWIAVISLSLAALFFILLKGDLHLSNKDVPWSVVCLMISVFLAVGYVITFPFGFLLKGEGDVFRALSVDYAGSIISLPILFLLPNLDYLLVLSMIIYLWVGLLMIKRFGFF